MKTIQTLIKDLTGINVEQNKISKYLENADLRCANLSYAKLQGANLQDTDLSFANLQDADLQGTEITKQQLEQLTVIEENE
ncbi:pentapeptide repeat-containing protein [Spiroplasma citri]|uniref:Pentapeptide repeat-containing protein n=1 Tax=Spiroplasma citri TaxID=2133 RepID=A0AAX3SZY0_SPICI|nr:pentapeptide repeat-containing protein [Spiroplasma citri]WFG96854.1 pentapeptide repeat-containing protein [Spiroplasma citri]